MAGSGAIMPCDRHFVFMDEIRQWNGRNNYIRVVLARQNGDIIPPAFVVDRGYRSGHGPVWTRASEGDLQFVEDSRNGDRVMRLIGGVWIVLPEMAQAAAWKMLRARYGTDELRSLPMPDSLAVRRLRDFQTRFPDLNLGRYVKIVKSEGELPAEVDRDFARDRQSDHDYAWSSFDFCKHHAAEGWKLAVVAYSHQPFHTNRYSVACRLE